MKLQQLNQLSSKKAYDAFESCCAAPNWVQAMTDARPFEDMMQLHALASQVWNQLSNNDYLQAFEAHPQIGNIASLKTKFSKTSQMAGHEQSSMQLAHEAVIQEMAKLNQSYLEKFGFIFIVFATGKSAEEMLQILKQRIQHDRAIEIQIAAQEQAKITTLRINKLMEQAV